MVLLTRLPYHCGDLRIDVRNRQHNSTKEHYPHGSIVILLGLPYRILNANHKKGTTMEPLGISKSLL